LSFVKLSWSKIIGKLAINRQNFIQVRLQIKFAFIIQPFEALALQNSCSGGDGGAIRPFRSM